MSRFDERHALAAAAAVALLTGLLARPAQAQQGSAAGGESPSAASIRNMGAASAARGAAARDAAVSAALPRRARPVLRCWQEGRLIFEGSGHVAGAANAPGAPPAAAAIELRHAARGELALQVFDLKNALCLLEHGES